VDKLLHKLAENAEQGQNMALAKFKFTTPKGNLKWAFVDGKGKETEQGSGKFKYSVVVKVPLAEAQEAIKVIDEFWTENKPKQAKPKAKSMAYKYEVDETAEENRTGYVLFGMSTSTTFPSGDSKVVKIFTAKPPVREVKLNGKKIGAESLGRGIGTLAIYEYNGTFGTTLFLDAISLSTFKEYVGGTDVGDVTTDDDADDIDLGETQVDTSAVQDETEKPRV